MIDQMMHDDGTGAKSMPVGQRVSLQPLWNDTDNTVWVRRSGFLVPWQLELASADDGCVESIVIKQQPARFDSSGLTAEQFFAVSKDGTRIPYFLLRPTVLEYDGQNATVVNAYGGFKHSLLPGYDGVWGKHWLAEGGVVVHANIRGGGEYGPQWHQAALQEKRYKAFEDMECVAQDLITRCITSPRKLAVIGGSNGGLMVGNMLTRPVASKLFGVAVCQVPLLDMQKYSHLLAGASWMAEYGNPDKAEDWSFLRRHSPYHLLRHDCLGVPEKGKEPVPPMADWQCPRVLFTTSTRDDRVHPGHARKFVEALLKEAPLQKRPCVLYYENMEGGHGGAANNKQTALKVSLELEFLRKELRLGGPSPSLAVSVGNDRD
jgi:prolyl oligopeptidase